MAGIEADINASGIEGKLGLKGTLTEGADYATLNGNAGSKLDYFGTVRGRIGWTNGPLLVYGTGGLAYGDVTSSITGSISSSDPGPQWQPQRHIEDQPPHRLDRRALASSTRLPGMLA
jgi:opacity protein-like surface antigen